LRFAVPIEVKYFFSAAHFYHHYCFFTFPASVSSAALVRDQRVAVVGAGLARALRGRRSAAAPTDQPYWRTSPLNIGFARA